MQREKIELDMLTIQAKPVKDLPELLPVCFLSGQTNPLLNPQSAGDMSISCGHLFVRSFAHFEVLPLVEFVPAPGLSDEDALELIRTPPPSDGGQGRPGGGGGRGGRGIARGGIGDAASATRGGAVRLLPDSLSNPSPSHTLFLLSFI